MYIFFIHNIDTSYFDWLNCQNPCRYPHQTSLCAAVEEALTWGSITQNPVTSSEQMCIVGFLVMDRRCYCSDTTNPLLNILFMLYKFFKNLLLSKTCINIKTIVAQKFEFKMMASLTLGSICAVWFLLFQSAITLAASKQVFISHVITLYHTTLIEFNTKSKTL